MKYGPTGTAALGLGGAQGRVAREQQGQARQGEDKAPPGSRVMGVELAQLAGLPQPAGSSLSRRAALEAEGSVELGPRLALFF